MAVGQADVSYLGLPDIRRGVEVARKVLNYCIENRIGILTLFAFSSENWNRPLAEVTVLMSLLKRLLIEELAGLHERHVKLQVIGDVSKLADDMRAAILHAQQLTHDNTGVMLNIALNYGGRWDIVQAVKKICQAVQLGQLGNDDISEAVLQSYLALSAMPEPDLLIRTSGEQRLSNFLLWQLAYTELFFTQTLWPDFSESDIEAAIDFFSQRERRFGLISEQQEHAIHA